MAEMSPLRRRMIEDMTIGNLSPATQRSSIHAVSKFSRHFVSMIAETGPQIFTEKGPRFETRTDGGARPGEAGRGCAAGASAGQ